MDADLMTGLVKRLMQNSGNKAGMFMKTKDGCGESRSVGLTLRLAPQAPLAAAVSPNDGNADPMVDAPNLSERTKKVTENQGCQFWIVRSHEVRQ